MDLLNNANAVTYVTMTEEQLKNYSINLISEVLNAKPQTAKDTKDLLTIDEVVAKLGITKQSLWRWEKTKYLMPRRIGKKKFYYQSDIDRIMGSKEQH